MYTAFLNEICILDPSKAIFLDDPVVELVENAAGSFSFVMYEDNPGYRFINHTMNNFVMVKRDSQILFKGRVISVEQDFDKAYRVECEGAMAYLDDTIQPPTRYQNSSIPNYLSALLNIHNTNVEDAKKFQLGMISVKEESYDSLYRFTNFESTLKAIKEDLLDDFGGHLRIRYQETGPAIIDYLEDYPRMCGQSIEFGENLLNYTESVSGIDLATACIPVGAAIENEEFVEGLDKRVTIEEVNGGSRELVLEDAVAVYGKITKTVTIDDVHTPSILKAKGMKWLEDSQYESLTLTLTALDLASFGLSPDHIELLDQIRCISKPHGMNKVFPVTHITLHLSEPELDQYELGDTQKSFSSSSSRAQKSIQQEIAALPSQSATLQLAQRYVDQKFNSDGKGGHVIYGNEEIWIMDSNDIDNAQSIWKYNIHGWAHSASGKNGPWHAATTDDGLIYGDRIVAGTIHADQIDAGYTTAQEKKWKDALDNEYWTAEVVESKIKNSAKDITLEVNTYTDTALELERELQSTVNLIQGADDFSGISKGSYATLDRNLSDAEKKRQKLESPPFAVLSSTPSSTAQRSVCQAYGYFTRKKGKRKFTFAMDIGSLTSGDSGWTDFSVNFSAAYLSGNPVRNIKVENVSLIKDGRPCTYSRNITYPTSSSVRYKFQKDFLITEGVTLVIRCSCECTADDPTNTYQIAALVNHMAGTPGTLHIAKLRMYSGWGYTPAGDGAKLLKSTSRIQVLEDKIVSMVTTGNFGTTLTQNAQSLRIAWNNISKYIQFEGAALNIYDSANPEDQQRVMSLRYDGQWFYRDGYTIGKIGTNVFGNTSHRGLVFDLNENAAYMAWGRKTSSSSNYIVRLLYANKRFSTENGFTYTADRFYMDTDIDHRNNCLYNAYLDDSCSVDVDALYGNIPSSMIYCYVNGIEYNKTSCNGTVYLPADRQCSSFFCCAGKRWNDRELTERIAMKNDSEIVNVTNPIYVEKNTSIETKIDELKTMVQKLLEKEGTNE